MGKQVKVVRNRSTAEKKVIELSLKSHRTTEKIRLEGTSGDLQSKASSGCSFSDFYPPLAE